MTAPIPQITNNSVGYYTEHGFMTDLGSYRSLFDDLPGAADALCAAVNGLMALDFWVNMGVLQVPEERQQEVNIRSVERKLEKILQLNSAALTAARPLEQRLLGNCRDLSLLVCAALRHHGIPARLRSGFATFFDPVRRFDHWICEYWHTTEQRWVRVDPWMNQIVQERDRLPSPLQAGLANLGMTTTDVESSYFFTGAQAWHHCRQNGENPDNYGTYGDLQGTWFVRDNLLRDLLCLNKVEVLPWDCWGLISGRDHHSTEEELARLDYIAAVLMSANPSVTPIRELYENSADLHIPAAYQGT